MGLDNKYLFFWKLLNYNEKLKKIKWKTIYYYYYYINNIWKIRIIK